MVDIIIPTYKARETLPQALDSLVCQTKKLFMVTVVQDCDGEDYSDIIEEYTNRGLKIRLITTPKNGGPGAARQYGMDKDTMCEFFMFLDSDDMLFPRAVEVLTREICINNADIISSNFIVEKAYTPGIIIDAQNAPCTWTHGKIYRAKYLREKNIRFLDDLRLNEDSYFNLVACNCTANKPVITENTYLWRENPNSLTRFKDDKKDAFFFKSWEMYIRSQVEGLLKIDEITNDMDSSLVGMTVINIYNHFMRAIYYELDLTNAVKYLDKLKNNENMQKAIDTEIFWKLIAKNLKPCAIIDDKDLIFYAQRFPEWLNQYLVKEVKNERVYH